jgi:hypothetical protein
LFAVRLTGIAALGLLAGIAWYLWPLRPNIVVLQLAFTPKVFGEVVHAWPPELLARYRGALLVGYALLAAYGAWGYLIATRSALFRPLAPALGRSARWWLPLAAVLNAVENALHWWLTAVPRFGVPLPYAVSAGCAAAKWLLWLAFGALLLYALARSELES